MMSTSSARISYRPIPIAFWLSFWLLFLLALAGGCYAAWSYHVQKVRPLEEWQDAIMLREERGSELRRGIFVTLYQDNSFQKPVRSMLSSSAFHFRTDREFAYMRTNLMGGRFAGWLVIPREGQYSFQVEADDGARVWIDGRMIFSEWSSDGSRRPSGEYTFSRGPVPLYVEWFNHKEKGNLGILWEGPQLSLDYIPASALRPDPHVTRPR